jgi:tetratricopeptide (TPR) repeat protein
VYFSRAIELEPTQASFFSNRAFAYIKMGEFKKGLEDSAQSITLDPKFARGYVR